MFEKGFFEAKGDELLQFKIPGSGCGASGRAMAFCPSKPGSNPGTDLAFFGNAINLFSLGVGLFLKNGS